MKAIYQHLSPASKIAVLTLTALIGLLVFMILSAVLVIPIFGSDAFSALTGGGVDVSSAKDVAVLKFFQLAQSIGLFVVPALVVAYLFGGNIGKYLLLSRKPLLVSSLLAIAIIVFANPMINQIGLWNAEMQLPAWLNGLERWMQQKEEAAAHLTEIFVQVETVPALLYNILLIGIIPAIGEELLFRGVIQKIFTQWTRNKHAAIWITAILFSALHLQFYGFFPRAVLGAMFGYMLVWSGNLWLPVLAHFINNTAAVIAYYLYHNGTLKIDPDAIGTQGEYGIAAVFSLVFVVGMFVLFYRNEAKKSTIEQIV
ncbi:CPBP family intramembrane glutamic endopeptidase [Roseimarinus sediminis]|jgi:hypothetical protein|uniref:CPBP family intramembrane glutamic endopeptidase n=1 Tax=Roseimarinus sediminis TaxID=1610899 RepID=UPI003D1C3F82